MKKVILSMIITFSTHPALVFKYLNGMALAEDEARSNASRASRTAYSQNGAFSPSQNGQILQELAGSAVSYAGQFQQEEHDDDDDIGSDLQQRSEGGTALPVVCLTVSVYILHLLTSTSA